MSNKLNDQPIILASESPRRKRLLEKAGIQVRVKPSGVDENAVCAEKPEDYVQILSRAKADTVSLMFPDDWVIGADSVVAIDDEILNKPATRADAFAMLSRLSDRTHLVFTGFSIFNRSTSHFYTSAETTEVVFKRITPEEIAWYLDTPEPYDKAGSYAIQGIGAFMVKEICGSYTNVVGLPLSQVIDHLAAHGAIRHERHPDLRDFAGKKRGAVV